jgi:hypothetical protein
MTDRLPEPVRCEESVYTERASATPSQLGRLATPRAVASAAPPRSLAETQRWLVDAITSGVDGAAVAKVITAGPQLDPASRLAIYQSGYFARLVECLRDDYPVIAAALGEERFHALCHIYILRFPSTSPSLNDYGRRFAELCRGAELLSERERAFYADLATFEWALVEVIHARTAVPLDAEALRAIPVEAFATARFERSPAVRLLKLAYPASAFYRAFRETGVVPALPDEAGAAVAVYRSGALVWRMELTPAMASVLGALLDGETIGTALEAVHSATFDAEAHAEAERSVMVWFREWVAGGMFTRLTFAEA